MVKTSEVFCQKVQSVMNETNRMTNFAYHKYDEARGYIPLFLYLFGNFCKYIIGLLIVFLQV